jgi:ADP-ribose pyrophosphatase YjhB (NUDIX family)
MSDRLYPPRPIIAASVAVFREGKVLLAARVNPPGAHVFSLPGGLVEIGETLEEAALRELMEEVVVEARIIGFVGHVEVIERDAEDKIRRHFVVNTFAAEWVSGEPQTGPEAAAVQWTDPASLGGLAVTKGLSGILDKAVRVMSETSLVR